MALQPITWKTIATPDHRKSAALLDNAQRNFQQALGSGQNIIDNVETRQLKGVQLNSDDFLARVRQDYSSPEDLQAAQEQGFLQQLRSQYSGLDTARTNTAAIDGMVKDARTRALEEDAYAQKQFEIASRPKIQQFEEMLRGGRTGEAEKFLDENELYNEGALTQGLYDSVQYHREEAAYHRARSVEDIQNEALGRFRNRQAEIDQKDQQIQQTLADNGFSPDLMYDPEAQSKLPHEQFQVFKSLVADAQMGDGYANFSDDMLKAEEAMRALGVSEREIVSYMNEVDTAANGLNSVSQIDQAAHDQELATLAGSYRGNSVIQDMASDQTPEAMLEEAYRYFNEITGDDDTLLFGRRSAELDELFSDIMSGGLQTKNKDGKDIKIQMGLGFLKEVIRRVPGRFDTDAKKVAKELIKTSEWQNVINDAADYQTQRNKLNANFNRRTGANRGQIRRDLANVNLSDAEQIRKEREQEQIATLNDNMLSGIAKAQNRPNSRQGLPVTNPATGGPSVLNQTAGGRAYANQASQRAEGFRKSLRNAVESLFFNDDIQARLEAIQSTNSLTGSRPEQIDQLRQSLNSSDKEALLTPSMKQQITAARANATTPSAKKLAEEAVLNDLLDQLLPPFETR